MPTMWMHFQIHKKKRNEHQNTRNKSSHNTHTQSEQIEHNAEKHQLSQARSEWNHFHIQTIFDNLPPKKNKITAKYQRKQIPFCVILPNMCRSKKAIKKFSEIYFMCSVLFFSREKLVTFQSGCSVGCRTEQRPAKTPEMPKMWQIGSRVPERQTSRE